MPKNTDTAQMEKIAQQLVAGNKGILAADESLPTIAKRFKKIGVPSTAENRRAWRELLFTTPGIEEHISGVILFEGTLKQKTENGELLPQVLAQKGVLPGIKVDQGKKESTEFSGEQVTQGLEGLDQRLIDYQKFGPRFTKWRAVYQITAQTPSPGLIKKNAQDLAQFAKISQEQGYVPIIEPEVLMAGDHDLQRCKEVLMKVLENIFTTLFDAKVVLEATLLKTNFVVPGEDSSQEVTPEQVARETLSTLRQVVSVALPGIVFLSGGLSDEKATSYLKEINKLGSAPWQLSFSFGRALQRQALKIWAGKKANFSQAQKAFLERAKMNSQARAGK